MESRTQTNLDGLGNELAQAPLVVTAATTFVELGEAAVAIPLTSERGKLRNLADRLGIGLSALCVVHCLATPFVILLIPAFESSPYHDRFHLALLFILPLLALLAFIPGYRRHRNRAVIGWSVTGLALVLSGVLVEGPAAPVWAQSVLSIAGSLCLIRAHWINRQMCSVRECGHVH